MTRIVADWLHAPAPLAVHAALAAGGAQVLFVGGCVRDALMGVSRPGTNDIDIATDAVPERVMELARIAGLGSVPTGFAHGTVTVVSGGCGFQVTTFRRDIGTDGRRAVVEFGTDIAEDAARRDFTMNALYARVDGTVVDPLHGLPDLRAGRLRFIGDARTRIREDYLRALRYFRFHAWYADRSLGFDREALEAVEAMLDGVDALSRERVGAEILGLLSVPDPAPEVAAMARIGLLAIVLPGSDPRGLDALVVLERQAGLDPEPARRLAALGEGVDTVAALRLRRTVTARIKRLVSGAAALCGAGELGYRMKAEALDALVLRGARTGSPLDPETLEQVRKGALARFPVAARDLAKTYEGRALGARLGSLERSWIASGFTLGRDELLGLPDGNGLEGENPLRHDWQAGID